MARAKVRLIAETLLPGAMEGGPLERLQSAAAWVRFLVAPAAAVSGAFLFRGGTDGARQVFYALLLGVYLPYAIILLVLSRRGGVGPAGRLATVIGDLGVVALFAFTVPSVRVIAGYGYFLIVAYVTAWGGRRAGVPVAAAAFMLAIGASLATKISIADEFTAVMLGVSLLGVLVIVGAGTREQRIQQSLRISAVSHELRNPLTSIEGFSATLRRHWDTLDEDARRELVELISRNAAEVHHLCDILLSVGKLEWQPLDLASTNIDLGAYVREYLQAHRPSLEGHDITGSIHDGLFVMADADAVGGIFSNLLANAVRHSPPGVPIEVRVRPDHELGLVVVSVRDFGAGLEPHHARRIFRPFYRAPGEKMGTGLGLALAHRYAIALGGRLGVKTAPGEGATFYFALPAIRPRAERTVTGN